MAEAGLPLTREFFVRQHRYDSKIYKRYYDDNPRFLRLLETFERWKTERVIFNIEDFFNFVDMQSMMRRPIKLSNGEQVDASTILRDLTWYISSYVVYRRRAQRNPPQEYRDFIDSCSNRANLGIITFNYDVMLERILLDTFGEFNYGFDLRANVTLYGDMRKAGSGMPYLKLHGSVNWQRCADCGSIEVVEEEIAQKQTREGCECGGMFERLIAPPAWNKAIYVNSIGRLWDKADKLLVEADKVVIAGYSLPSPDHLARELFVRTLTEKNRKAKVEIVNQNESIKQRFEETFRRPVVWKDMSFCKYVSKELA